MNNFLFSVNIVMPLALMLAMGYVLKKTGFFDDVFISTGKRFCFYVLLSSNLFKNLYDSGSDGLPLRFTTFVVIAIMAEILISFLIAEKITDQRNEKGVIVQGLFRSNFAYIGIPLSAMFFTDPLLVQKTSSEISLMSIFVIPLYNIFSVLVLTYYGGTDAKNMFKRSLKGIITNPCIISIFCGLGVLFLRQMIPGISFMIRDDLPFLYQVLSYLSSMSTPFAFLIVGAGLDFSHSVSNIRKLSIVILFRNLIYPFLILMITYFIRLADQAEYAILVSIFASPTAVASAIMAAQMKADEKLADEIVMYSALFSIVSLFIIIYCLKMAGCL